MKYICVLSTIVGFILGFKYGFVSVIKFAIAIVVLILLVQFIHWIRKKKHCRICGARVGENDDECPSCGISTDLDDFS